jgi:hypothetical protein
MSARYHACANHRCGCVLCGILFCLRAASCSQRVWLRKVVGWCAWQYFQLHGPSMRCAGSLFSDVLDVALQVPQQLPRNKILRVRFLSYLHRMVECLGSCMVPFLPRAFDALLHDQCDAGDIGDVVRLVLQLLAAFPSQIEDQLSILLPSVIMRCAPSSLQGRWLLRKIVLCRTIRVSILVFCFSIIICS